VNLSELLSKGLVEKFQSDPDQIKNEIEIAKNDLSSAKNMLGIEEWGWAHNAAYNAMLQAGRALNRRPVATPTSIPVIFIGSLGGPNAHEKRPTPWNA